LALGAAVALALLAISGGSGTDPRTPAALPGMPAPFLGTAVAGDGGLTAAVDAYGDVVDLRPQPAGRALIDNPAARQAAGTVDAEGTGIVPRVSLDGGPALAFWRADTVVQRYLPGTNVVRTVARFGRVRVTVTVAARDEWLAIRVGTSGGEAITAAPSVGVNVEEGVRCARQEQPDQLDLLCRVGRAGPVATAAAAGPTGREVSRVIGSAAKDDRRWLAPARRLGESAPAWAVQMYQRSLLTLRALTDRENGAAAAGARDGWAYVWPRDAGAAAIALASAGYRSEATLITRFLLGLDLEGAARFHGDGSPVPGRAAQGDAVGWTAAAAEASGLIASAKHAARILGDSYPVPWRNRADYQEGEPGNFLGNAIASGAPDFGASIGASNSGARAGGDFAPRRGLVRRAGDPGSGLDSAAAWAVRPFATPALYPRVRSTLRGLAAERTPFGITPGEGWSGGVDPWMAPTAWSAWSLAALARDPGANRRAARSDRRLALALLADLRRAATPAGALPERVDAVHGIPTSTTPLAWPHAFTILALRELWPGPGAAAL
jgi:hypothetical protein